MGVFFCYNKQAMKESLVIVNKLVKKYGPKTAVNKISFKVGRGEIFGILGPNGAGKTTTLEMMETLRGIDGGSVSIDGIDVATNPQYIKSKTFESLLKFSQCFPSSCAAKIKSIYRWTKQ